MHDANTNSISSVKSLLEPSSLFDKIDECCKYLEIEVIVKIFNSINDGSDELIRF